MNHICQLPPITFFKRGKVFAFIFNFDFQVYVGIDFCRQYNDFVYFDSWNYKFEKKKYVCCIVFLFWIYGKY